MSDIINKIAGVYDSVKKKDLKIILKEMSDTVEFLEECLVMNHKKSIDKYLVNIIDGLKSQLKLIVERL